MYVFDGPHEWRVAGSLPLNLKSHHLPGRPINVSTFMREMKQPYANVPNSSGFAHCWL